MATTVVVEYTIKVTNEGEVDAYVRKIADYLSSDYKFSSELNKVGIKQMEMYIQQV